MSFHRWSGLESEFAHENEQIIELSKILKEWLERAEEEVHLLTNFYVNAEEVDALVLLPKSDLIVIDLKSGSGTITGQENGDWYCTPDDGNEFKINKGRRNPLNQASRKRYAIIKYLENRKDEIFGPQKAPHMDFYHTNSVITFSGPITWDKEQLPSKYLGWFDVLGLEEIPEKLNQLRSKKYLVNIDKDEAWRIPTLLSLTNEDEETEAVNYIEPVEEIFSVKEKKEENNINFKEGFNELVQGCFSGMDDNKIKIKFSDGAEKNIFLNDFFEGTVGQLKKLSNKRKLVIEKDEIEMNLLNVNYSNGIFVFTEDSLIVLEPEWLINVTALTQFDFCERSLFNRRYSIQEQNEFMMRGSIIHEVFETIFDNNEDAKVKARLNESVTKRGLEFALSRVDPNIMVQTVEPHIKALSAEVKKRLTDDKLIKASERFIINPYLGLKGKIDAVINNDEKMRAIELKTGKSWGGKVKPGHAFQAQAYSLLMEHKYDQQISDPSVIYTGDHPFTEHLSKRAEFSYSEKAHVIHLRNKLVLADYLFELEYTDNPKKCPKCSEKTICSNLYQLEIEHDLNNVPPYQDEMPVPPNEKWSEREKNYFNRYNKWLTEEYRTIKEKEGEYFCKTVEKRIADLKCVIINNCKKNKNNEYVLFCNNESEIRDSDAVLISDEKGPVHGECIEAYVKTVSKNSITISTRVEINEGTFKPKYLDKHDSETVFERNFAAAYQLLDSAELKGLKDIILGTRAPISNRPKKISKVSGSAEYQIQDNAVRIASGIEDFLLIKGPPGTGKTVTVAKIIEQLVNEDKKVIVSCYTHRAVNEVIKKVKEYSPDIVIYKIGSRLEEEDGVKVLEKEIKKEGDIDSQIKSANTIIDSCPVYIGTTHAWLSGRFDNLILRNEDNSFDIAIIDEASQVILPSILGVVRLAKKFILVGDEKQLPPVIQSELAKGLEETLFEKLYNDYYENKDVENVTVMLNNQHRMAEPIANFISHEFYDGHLNTAENCKNQQLRIELNKSELKNILDPNKPMTLVHTETSGIVAKDRTNPHEVKIITDILTDLIKCGVSAKNIGIIAPYRAQVAEMRRSIELNLHEEFESSFQGSRIVDTVDRFQGDERDIILFSLCLLRKDIPRVLQDTRRINVAISRAKLKFIGVGNWNLVENSKVLSSLINYVRNNEGCSFVNWEK